MRGERLAFENILKRKIQEVAGLDRSFSCFSFARIEAHRLGSGKQLTRVVEIGKTIAVVEIVRFCTTSVNDAGHLEHSNRWSRFRVLSRISRRRFIYNAAGHYATPGHNSIVRAEFLTPRAHTRSYIGEEQSETSVLHAAHRSLKSLGPCVGDPRENFNV